MRQADLTDHARRTAALLDSMHAQPADASPLGLSKSTSNLFRDRAEGRKRRLDLSDFCHVLEIDTARGWVDVEGLVTCETLVDATLPHGVMPAVVPQLKTITVAGAVAGVGIEATSFRHGLVHDTLLELDVLLPDGEVVCCTPDNAHRDLFFGFPNSYGTLGYALRLRLRTVPVLRCVQVEHRTHSEPSHYFDDVAEQCAGRADFVDGVVFGANQQVLSVARFVDEAPWLSDYRFEHIYYRSLLQRERDFLTTRDYLWRWDTDWFWCSKNFGAQQPLLRRLIGRKRLNSRTYARWMRWNARWRVSQRLARWRGRHVESVIQDVDIPMHRAGEFLEFLLREIGIVPIWVCPIRAASAQARFTLYPLAPGVRYVNFGFWDRIESAAAHAPGHFNRLVECKVLELGGIKSLYSDSYYTREEFDRAYGADGYAALKRRYDPQHRLLGLYEKCVLRA
ncbi:MAG: FAD-binding oxidoreductase [Burkholderiales bacterium]|nr:FAD-binding oxidoreductase [Burkholderiales bacterium]